MITVVVVVVGCARNAKNQQQNQEDVSPSVKGGRPAGRGPRKTGAKGGSEQVSISSIQYKTKRETEGAVTGS